jgi:hypothetical protein
MSAFRTQPHIVSCHSFCYTIRLHTPLHSATTTQKTTANTGNNDLNKFSLNHMSHIQWFLILPYSSLFGTMCKQQACSFATQSAAIGELRIISTHGYRGLFVLANLYRTFEIGGREFALGSGRGEICWNWGSKRLEIMSQGRKRVVVRGN